MSGSNTFGGTIKLEGEKEYRRAISQINSDLKVLASEMGKVTAEFGKNNKSASSLSSQSKVLNEQIRNQKEKISTLKGALQEASEKYGENDKRTNTWRTSLNKAETELSKMEKNLNDVNSEMTKSQSPLEKLTTKISEQEDELKALQTQYKNVVLEQGKNSSEAKELAGQIKDLNGDIKENKNKLNEAEQATDELGDEMDDTSKKTSIFGEILKANLVSDMIKSGLSSIANGIKNVANAITDVILKPGFDRAMNIEQAQFKLKGLGHDTETVDAIMKNALNSVRGTAYGLDDAATVAASAVAAGVQPGQELERTLKLVADASAIAGSDLSEMGGIFNKVATAGKISAQEINQLNERGIPITQLLAETMNVSTQEVQKLVSAGKVGFPEFEAAIEKGMGGAALTMGQTFEGASANVQAAFSRMGAGILTPFTSALTPALGIIITLIDDITAGTTENIEEKTSQLGEILKNSVSALFAGLEPMLQSLLGIFNQILPEIAKILPDVANMAIDVIVSLVNGISGAIPTLIPAAMQIITSLVSAIIGALPQLTQAAVEILAALVSGIGTALPTLIPAIVDAVILISTTLLDNLDLIIEAGIELLMGLIKAIEPTMSALLEKLPDIITSIVNCLVENIPILLEGAIELFMALVKAIPEIVVQLTQALPQIIEAIIAGLSRLPELLWNILLVCIQKFTNWGNQSEETGKNGMQNFIDSVINLIKELPSKIWNWLSNAFQKVVTWGSNMISKGAEIASNFMTKIINQVRELPSKIWTWLSNAVQKVIAWGSDMVSKGRQAASDLFNAIVNKVREIPSQMLSIGSNIVSGIWSGISGSIGWITSKVREFARGILDGIKSALGIHSPSTVFEQEVGKNMALGVGEGFVNAMDNVKREMQEAIPTNFDTNLNMLPNSANSISNIKNTSEVGNNGIFGKLDSILSLLEYYIPALQNRQLCLDTGVLVGELTPPINKELARIEMSKERGR